MKDQNLEKITKKAEALYKTFGSITCPFFEEEVIFNRKGINHIKFKSERNARNRRDQYMRLKHIEFAKKILSESHTLQEFKEMKTLVDTKNNGQRKKVLKNTKFYGFIAIINDKGFLKRLKIIVKEVDGGKKHFWSIVPFWKSNKELKIHSGNPEIE